MKAIAEAMTALDQRARAVEPLTDEAFELICEPGVVELVRSAAAAGIFGTAPALLESQELRKLWGPCPRCRRYTALLARTGRAYQEYVEWSCGICFPQVRAEHGDYVGHYGFS
jgi:hypothetical protein